MSAHTHQRALRFRTAGFEFDETHDYWLCPEGEQLWPHEFERERRLVRYRARAHVCNACHIKHRCTDSDRGREITRPLDPWPHSEAGRFHRVIALLLIVLAAVILLFELVRNHAAADALASTALLVLVGFGAHRLLRDIRTHPTNAPVPTGAHGLRLNVTAREVEGP